ncbi:SGNH/GDSL hydrolase family protein [Peribacillus frigoritolerans]|uniref:SGNH/GDSL hydrolase family protein n=1 Tax=Peribacillus frigoritolerans TaxID=450367 RepID=UPI002E9DA621|nr:SGNH/GDSL hydrolase family protein [Peribacillus frigoritolerans]
MRRGGTIKFGGDSNTFGLGIPGNTPYGTYAAKIAKTLNDTYGSCRYINKAISGWKSGDFITVPSYWLKADADLFVLHIGTNDAANAVPVTTFKSNLNKIVDMVRSNNPDTEIILCSIARRSDAFANALDPYRAAVTEVATSKETYLCKFEDAWLQADTATYMQADGLHLNTTGHQKIHDILWTVIQQTNFVESLS